MNPLPPLLSTGRLAEQLGLSRVTLHRWGINDPTYAACVQRRSPRRTYWSTQRLIDAGILMRPSSEQGAT